MASSAVVDLNTLLAPIPGQNPAGESVRYAGVYDAIQEARRADDELPQGEWQREVKTADWTLVLKIATETLGSKSKDLQIAAWLVEALVKRQGFAGARDGFRLMRELTENFWEVLYPVIEDGDLESRASPLEWLNEKLPGFIKDVALTDTDERYSWHHWEESRTVDNLGRQNPNAKAAAVAQGKVTGEQFDKAVAITPRSFYETIFEDLIQGCNECEHLIRVVDDKFVGIAVKKDVREAPSLLEIRRSLEECRVLIEDILKEKRKLDPNYRAAEQPPKLAQESESGQEPAARSHTVKPNSIPDTEHGSLLSREPASREDAVERLEAIADYLRRTEPQSPVSYLVERAAKWSRMPLEEWLREVVHNEDVLKQLRETLGVKE